MNIGLKRGTVMLMEHDPKWRQEFEQEVARLKKILPVDVGPFEHIGSTAIPGIPAKPIIDFMLGVKDLKCGIAFKPVLESAGYEYRSNADNTDRVLFVLGPESCRSHHFSIVTFGSSQWKNALGFRDILTSNPSLAARYAKLKRDLEIEYAEERSIYTQKKEPFFQEVFEILSRKSHN